MKKLFTLLLLASTLHLHAQLPDGSIAPDWTATDINGTEWNLYQLLAEGKSVVIEVSATWSYNSWMYHESGALANFHETYGPDGTDEARVFFFEADNSTDASDLDGTGDNTSGNWLANTPYPIIDDAEWMAGLYEAYGYPDVMLICPNRLLTETGLAGAGTLSNLVGDCLVPGGEHNAGIYFYVGFQGDFCEAKTFAPSVIWQNLGTENITSATFELWRNGSLEQSSTWTGNLAPYATIPRAFNAVTVTENTDFDLRIAAVNGVPDEFPDDNDWQVAATVAPITDQNFLRLEILTDDYPREIYWEMQDADGTVFHRGGNPGIFTNEVFPGAYTDGATLYEHEVPLPADGCYEFVIYDEYADGICCGGGIGYYRLLEPNNAIIMQGGLFTTPSERRPFSLAGAQTILNDAAIRGYDGPAGDFCGTLDFAPQITVQNLGANDLTSVSIVAYDATGDLQNFTQTTQLAPGETGVVQMDGISINESNVLIYSISGANGQADANPVGSSISVQYDRRTTESPALVLDLQTDNWGYEIYWQMTNSAGDPIASGGNPTIGPDGGGLQVATINDPGSYGDNQNFSETINLTPDVNDCYTFLFVDDWGDGLGGSGYLRLTDEAGNILFNFYPTGTYEAYLIDAQLVESAVAQTGAVEKLDVSPNPASTELVVSFSLSQNTDLQVGLFDALGRAVLRLADGHFAAGQHSLSVDVAGLPNGVYFLRVTDGDGTGVRRVVRS